MKGLLLAGLGGGCTSRGAMKVIKNFISSSKHNSPVSLGGKTGLLIPIGGAGLGGRRGAPDLEEREGTSGGVGRGVGTG